jgi:hypothetical protein
LRFIESKFTFLREEQRELWQPIITMKISPRNVRITLEISNLKAMFDVNRFIAIVVNFKHADRLDPQGDSRQNQFSTIEIKRWILTFSFKTNLRLLLIDSFFFIVDMQGDFMIVGSFLYWVETDIYRN